MKIAFIGMRGVPARYGGFETCAEELGKRLARRGHDVRVYCRSRYYPDRLRTYEGMTLIYRPAFRARTLETLSHTALSLGHAALRANDVCLVFNTANSPLLWIARTAGKRIVVHTDGLEWERDKWRGWGGRYFKWAATLATRLSVPLISDSLEIQAYYRRVFHRETHFIAYGAPLLESRDPSLLRPFGLVPGEYVLQLARFEPENNFHLTIEAFARLSTPKKLVLVGGSAYESDYIRRLRATRDSRAIFTGFVYETDVLCELLTNAYVYIHGNEAGGTNPGLLQAMGAGCAVLARDVPFNREVGGLSAVYYDKDADDLGMKLRWALDHPGDLSALREGARRIIRDRYEWEAVTDDYERLLFSAVS
jgi:glycosyltransferase involved in cell wall biosynthesis